MGNALLPGTKVKHIDTGEVGIIVHGWFNPTLECNEYHVAFYGYDFPEGQPAEPPYILRYLGISLSEFVD